MATKEQRSILATDNKGKFREVRDSTKVVAWRNVLLLERGLATECYLDMFKASSAWTISN